MSAMTVSGRQLQRIHMRLSDLGIHDRDMKLRVLSAILYDRVASSKDLTAGEATVCEATLRSLPDHAALVRMVTEAEARMKAATS